MVLERTYIVPLRCEWSKVSRYKRSKKAVAGLRTFLLKHMKSDDVRIGKFLNLELWKHGMQNPPARIKVTAKKFDDGVVRAELFGKQIEEPKKDDDKKKSEGVAEKVKKALGEKKKEQPKAAEQSASPASPMPAPLVPMKKSSLR